MFRLPQLNLRACGFVTISEYTGRNADAIKKLGIRLIVVDSAAQVRLDSLTAKRIAGANSIKDLFSTKLLVRLKIKALLVEHPQISMIFLGDPGNIDKLPAVISNFCLDPGVGERVMSSVSPESRELVGHAAKIAFSKRRKGRS
jgi:hypothetical protein